jgi:hypothetical protein
MVQGARARTRPGHNVRNGRAGKWGYQVSTRDWCGDSSNDRACCSVAGSSATHNCGAHYTGCTLARRESADSDISCGI